MNELLDTVLNDVNLEPKLIEEAQSIGRLRKVKEGRVVISPGNSSDEIPLVLKGLLKVMRQDSSGQEVFLYYLEGGETCAMSITCCLEGKISAFKVIAEEDSLLWMIPMSQIDSWTSKYPSFKRYVFQAYQTRFDELLNAIDSVVFHNMDERLFRYLLDTKQATGSYEIRKTHQQIADELSTSRVVISRLLKKLEKEGKIEQYRNRIDIL